MGVYTPKPTPTPNPYLGAYSRPAPVPQPAPAPVPVGGYVLSASTGGTGNADTMWNQGWNTGFNSGGAANTNTDPNFSSGYGTGWGEYQKRNAKPSSGGGNNLVNNIGNNNTGDIFGKTEQNAKDAATIELEGLMGEYDQYQQQRESDLSYLGTQKENALSTLNTGYGRMENQAKTAKEEATTATQSAQGKALSTAQDVTRKNRNVLRALGILSSSAAGEMLSKPMTEYGTQSGELEQGLIKRKQVVDDWLGERLTDYTQQVKETQGQYAKLTGDIQMDMRFSQQDKIQAVKAANKALDQRIQDIKLQAQQYQMAAQNYNANIISQITQMKLYQNPQADISGLLGTLINLQQPSYGGGQVGTQQTEEERKKALGLR